LRIRIYKPTYITLLAKDEKNRPFIEIECEDADQWEKDDVKKEEKD